MKSQGWWDRNPPLPPENKRRCVWASASSHHSPIDGGARQALPLRKAFLGGASHARPCRHSASGGHFLATAFWPQPGADSSHPRWLRNPPVWGRMTVRCEPTQRRPRAEGPPRWRDAISVFATPLGRLESPPHEVRRLQRSAQPGATVPLCCIARQPMLAEIQRQRANKVREVEGV